MAPSLSSWTTADDTREVFLCNSAKCFLRARTSASRGSQPPRDADLPVPEHPVTSATSVTLVIPHPVGITLVFLHQCLELLLLESVRHITSAYPACGSPHEVLRATLALTRPLRNVAKLGHAALNETQTTDVFETRLVPNGTGTEPKPPPPVATLTRKFTSLHSGALGPKWLRTRRQSTDSRPGYRFHTSTCVLQSTDLSICHYPE